MASRRLLHRREVVDESNTTTTTQNKTRTDHVTTATTVDTYRDAGRTITETTSKTRRITDTIFTYTDPEIKYTENDLDANPEEQDIPPSSTSFVLEAASLGHAVAWRLPLDDDPDVPRSIREHVRARIAPPRFMRHVAQFQARDLALGRDTDAPGRRAQRAAREWFRQREPSFPSDIEIDHVVLYGKGGAHTSLNATLLTKHANASRRKHLVFRDIFLAGSVRSAARAWGISRTRGNATHRHPNIDLPLPVGYDGPIPDVARDASVDDLETALRRILRYLQLPEVRLTDGDLSIHPDCRVVRRGDVRFLDADRIDPTCPAARTNYVRLRKDGWLNRTCSAVKRAHRDRA